jgi:hypothetical protein
VHVAAEGFGELLVDVGLLAGNVQWQKLEEVDEDRLRKFVDREVVVHDGDLVKRVG